jgi:hypothetical protein
MSWENNLPIKKKKDSSDAWMVRPKKELKEWLNKQVEVVPVLTWYGDEDNHEKYMEQFTFTNHAPLEIETTKVHEDFGKRARALLAKIKAEGDKNG